MSSSNQLTSHVFRDRKKIEKKHLCRHEKNYYYFWKSNIPVFNLILDFRNMLKVPKV